MKTINGINLFGDLPLVEQLSRLWPLREMPGLAFDELNLEESIFQHCVRNDDWSNAELLEVIGVLTCSRGQLFQLIEAVVSPNARRGEEQTSLVEALNKVMKADGYHLVPSGAISGHTTFLVACIAGGVAGSPKNLIFASIGPKPEIVIQDAINNDIKIVRNEKHCLIYDQPIESGGLTKEQMVAWWRDHEGITDDIEARRSLY